MSMKNSNDTIGNRSRDLPVCSVVQIRWYTAHIPLGFYTRLSQKYVSVRLFKRNTMYIKPYCKRPLSSDI